MHNRALVHRARALVANAGPLPHPPPLAASTRLLSTSARKCAGSPPARPPPPPHPAGFHTSRRRRAEQEQPAEATASASAPQATEVPQGEATSVDPPAAAQPEGSEEKPAPPKEDDKEDRPRRRRAPTSRPTAELPPEYATSHLWSPDVPSPSSPHPSSENAALPSPQMVHDALTSVLLCLHPQTQHRSLYPGPGGQSQVEPTLAMYCPIEGGEYVLDETVREVARRAGAEVVVLDTAQLAAGVHGVFGRSAGGFQLPSNPLQVTALPSSSTSSNPVSYNPNEEDDDPDSPSYPPASPTLAISIPATMHFPALPRSKLVGSSAAVRGPRDAMRTFFDEIVNLPSIPAESEPSTTATSPTPASGSTSTSINTNTNPSTNTPAPITPKPTPRTPPKPRIIYIRDFPLLAPTSSHWYPELLASVRARRAGPITRPSQAPPNPTIILFGCTPPLVPQLVVSPPANSGGLLGMLLGTARGGGQGVIRTEGGSEEEDVKGRERRLRERLQGWEKNEPLWLASELPVFGGSPPPTTGRGGAGPAGVVGGGEMGVWLGGGFVEYGQQEEGVSGGVGGEGGGRAGLPYFRALTLLPAKRDPGLETATRLARRREVNMLAMRMAVGAVGGVLPELEEGGKELEEEEMWREWGRRVEPWSAIRAVASRAVGGVVAELVQASVGSAGVGSGVGGQTLDPTPIPWSAVLDAWAQQRGSHAVRKAWVDSARAAAVLPPGEEEEGREEGEEEEKEDEVIARVRKAEDLEESEQRLLGCIVDPRTMPTTFASVHLPEGTIDSIRTIVSLPLLHPQAFSQGILKQHAMTGVLLFGVPGTGKTLVVRALARESGARMLMVKPSDIMDMYVGQSEKLVRSLFNLARRLSPCIIFLDEIDALFGARVSARETGGAIAHRQVITEFMQEMDGLRTKEGGVLVIGATNRPFDLDEAVLRRLPRRLLVDLPGEKERGEILKILLRDEILAPEVDVGALAKRTEGFSGSDLKHLCVSAALDAVKETVELPWAVPRSLIKDTLALTNPVATETMGAERAEPSSALAGDETPLSDRSTHEEGNSSSPSSASDSESIAALPSVQRTLRPQHFAKALTEITASTSEYLGTLSDLRKWNEEFGEGGKSRGRRKRWGDKFGFGLPEKGEGKRETGQVGKEP